jgi:hypothetical protein
MNVLREREGMGEDVSVRPELSQVSEMAVKFTFSELYSARGANSIPVIGRHSVNRV